MPISTFALELINNFEWLEPKNTVEVVVGESYQLKFNCSDNTLPFTSDYADYWNHYDFDGGQHMVSTPTGYSINEKGVITGLVPGTYAIKFTGYILPKSGINKMLMITVVSERSETESNNTLDTANDIYTKIRFGLFNTSDVDYFKFTNGNLKWGDAVTFKIHYYGSRENPFGYKWATFCGTNMAAGGSLNSQDQECRALVSSGNTVYLEVYYDQSLSQYFNYGEEFVAEVYINGEPASGVAPITIYKLTYIVDEEEYKNYEVEYGTTITPEEDPTKEGYTFSGWSEIPATMPAQDLTITGSFTANKYKLTYIIDGEEYKTIDVAYGASITAEAEPTKEGYSFSGWSEIPATMPAHDVNVSGTFTVQNQDDVDITKVEIDGIFYNLIRTTKQAEVTSNPYEYSGSVNIPEKVQYEGMGYSVTSIDEFAFSGCSGLTSVNIPNCVTSIGKWAFSDCNKLPVLKLPDNLVYIGESAFQDCYSIVSLTIPNSVTTIETRAFQNCNGIVSLTISSSLSKIDDYVFSGCSIPTVNIPNSVVTIGTGAFQGCKVLTSVDIPNSVIEIGTSAFYGCSGLVSVTIPNSIKSIGMWAFMDCPALNSINISDLSSWCRIEFEYGGNPLCEGHHLFLNGSEIKDLIIPNNVSEIKENAFSGGYFNTITIPEGIVSIGKSAFEGCSELKSISLPNSLESLGVQLFYGCTNLESILIPNRVTKIETNTFLECANLSTVSIPDNVVSIGEQAFEGCLNLKSIKLPSGLLSIGRSAFKRCINLKSISIPDGVTILNEETFQDCAYLKSVKLPESLYIIGKNVFSNCGVVSIDLSDPVAEYPEAIIHYYGLESIVIPEHVEYIYQEAFSDCPSLKKIEVQPATPPFLYDNSFSNFSVPLKVPKGCKEAYQSAQGWKNFTNISDADKYNLIYVVDNEEYKTYEIEEGANIATEPAPTKEGYTFSGWSEIPETMPSHDVTVTGAFSINKYKLTYTVDGEEYKSYELEYGATITPEMAPTKEDYTFNSWNEIPETMPACDVVLSGYFTEIIETGFCGENLTWKYGAVSRTLTISGTGPMDNYDFFGDSSAMPWKGYFDQIEKVIIEDGVTSIGDYAFYGCVGLTSVDIPNSVTFIGWFAFGGCSSLPNVTIPNSVIDIGTGAFWSCSGLTSVTIENGIKSINIAAFANCTSLTSLVLPESVTSISEEAFVGCTNLTTVIIPNSVKYIGFMAFQDCKSLTSVIIPDGITSINYETFQGCSGLTSITIPNSVTSIEDEAFSGCTSITDIYCLAEEVPSTGINVFNNANIRNATLHVSGTSKEKYKNDAVWGAFGTIVAPSYTLTFIVDGEEYNSFVIEEGTDITIEYHPQKKGYTFTLLDEMPETMPSHDVTVTGSFTINKYTLAYVVDGENYVTYEVNYGTQIFPLPELTKDGYTFSGWSEIPETMPAKDVTITGSFNVNSYKLTYMVNGEEYKTIGVEYGATITAEAAPMKEGYTFSGWNEVPATMPANDVTVTGSFAINSYKLTYIVDSEEYKSVQVKYGEEITPEVEPAKDGYTFSGWNDIPATMPAKDITVTGSFIVNSYKLTYMVDGEEYKMVDVAYGASIIAEAAPTKEGYSFSGWVEMPATMPSHDVTVTGSFTINKYTLAYVVDGENYVTYEVNYGTQIFPLPELTKDGYTFSGWSAIPETMPAHDVTITGAFTFVDAIEGVTADDGEYQIYTIDGKPIETLQKGVNIIRFSNGTTKKVGVK